MKDREKELLAEAKLYRGYINHGYKYKGVCKETILIIQRLYVLVELSISAICQNYRTSNSLTRLQ